MASLRSLLFSQFVSGAENTFLKVGTLGTTVQPLLVSNTNIKTVVGQTLLGSGNVALSASDIPNLDASKITSGTIDAARLPSYVDDVLEYTNLASFPATGEAAKIYVALDSNKVYRWSGSTYVEISPAPDLSGYLPLSGGTITGSLTLNTGTANGVAYLNGSKVLTTGSALTFDGTNFVLGTSGAIRTSGASGYFETQLSYYLNSGGGGGFQLKGLGSGVAGIKFMDAADSTELMRLNTTGLGIGTSSPDQALVVNKASGSTYVKVSGANNVNNDLALHFTDGTNNAYFGMMRGTSGGIAGALHSYTGGAIRTTLDSSGNFGIGTSSPVSKLDVRGNLNLGDGTNNSNITNTTDAAFMLLSGGTSTQNNIRLYGPSHPTLANVQTFITANTERLRITSGGLVGINTTAPAGRLHVVTDSAADSVRITSSSGSNPAGIVYTTAGVQDWSVGVSGSAFVFSAGNIFAGSERVRIASNGNFAVGTTMTDVRMQVHGPMYVPAANFKGVLAVNGTESQAAGNGAGITLGGVFTGTSVTTFAQIAGIKENSTDANYAGALALYTRPNGDTLYERMRISSSGGVSIGTTSDPGAGALIIGRADSSSEGGEIRLARASDNANAFGIDCFGTGTTPSLRFIDNAAGAERLRIGPAGQIGLGGANYGTAGQVLTSNGSGSAPSWQAAGGGASVVSIATGTFQAGVNTLSISLPANWETTYSHLFFVWESYLSGSAFNDVPVIRMNNDSGFGYRMDYWNYNGVGTIGYTTRFTLPVTNNNNQAFFSMGKIVYVTGKGTSLFWEGWGDDNAASGIGLYFVTTTPATSIQFGNGGSGAQYIGTLKLYGVKV